MMSKFELRVEGKINYLKFSGAIDESTAFPNIVDCEKLVIDLDELTRINSMGIRVWLIWMRSLAHLPHIELENCRGVFIRQVELIRSIIPENAVVMSFYVPLFDVTTGESSESKMVRGADFDEHGYRVPKIFSSKGTLMELDVSDWYFQFLKRS